MFDRVFVTVGTTSFQPLIQLIVSKKAIKLFVKWNVKEVRIQGGKHSVEKETNTWTDKNIKFEMYDYKSSITEDLQWADIIISHAGAGTTIEALDLKKILLVVPNETLMGNHQLELAHKLNKENYAFMATVNDFFERAAEVDPSKVKQFPPACPEKFNEHLLQNLLS